MGAGLLGTLSFPLVFHLDTCLWFNEWCVTADIAEDRDLETVLEVGKWSWQWMEPVLGQLSFALLCCQVFVWWSIWVGFLVRTAVQIVKFPFARQRSK